MKKIISISALFLLVIIALSHYSCTHENDYVINVSENTALGIREKPSLTVYRACWVDWGRKKYECKSWGLCYFEDCWFPQIYEEDCCKDEAQEQGLIIFDPDTEECNMTITLDNIDSLEVLASYHKLDLHVDETIKEPALHSSWDTLVMKAGTYPFNEELGQYGGYIIPIQIIK